MNSVCEAVCALSGRGCRTVDRASSVSISFGERAAVTAREAGSPRGWDIFHVSKGSLGV